MFEDVRGLLAAAGLALDGAELLDALWLARALPPGASWLGGRSETAPAAAAPALPADPPETEPAGNEEPAQPLHASPPPRQPEQPPAPAPPRLQPEPARARPVRRTAPVWVPGAKALRDERLIGRAFRPVKRRAGAASMPELDEAATADAQAETRIALPVLKTPMERWTRVALVIDGGLPMLLWERLCTELAACLERSGAFRQVTVHQIRHADRGILVGRPWTASAASRSAASLTDPTGSTMMLVLTDGAGPAWRDGGMRRLLDAWAAAGPTAILHTLPTPFWAGTSVDGDIWSVSAPDVGAPNARWRVTHPYLPRALAAFDRRPVPVLPLTAAGLSTWAALTTTADRPATVRLWEPERSARTVPRRADLRDFGRTASAEAVRLAAHLAAVAPLTVPVMQLVDAGIPDGPDPARLAEVLLSGLLQPADRDERAPADPRHLLFDFAPEAKDALLDELPTDELVKAGMRVGERLEQLAGRSRSFPAWLAPSRQTAGGGTGPYPFARVSPVFLRRFGVPAAPTEPPGESWPIEADLFSTIRALIDNAGAFAEGPGPTIWPSALLVAAYVDDAVPAWPAVEDIAARFARSRRRELTDEFRDVLREQYVEAALQCADMAFAAVLADARLLVRHQRGRGYAHGPHAAAVEFLLLQLLTIAERYRDAPRAHLSIRSFAAEIAEHLLAAGVAAFFEDLSPDPMAPVGMTCRSAGSSIALEVRAGRLPRAATADFSRPRVSAGGEAAPVGFVIVADSSLPGSERPNLGQLVDVSAYGGPSGSSIVSLRIPVRLDEPVESLPSTARQGPTGGRRYVFAVGVGAYQADDIPDLPQAVPDSDRFCELLAALGYQRILAEQSRNPTASDLREALRAWLIHADPQPEDCLVVYFAGHGRAQDGWHYLLAQDSDLAIESTQVTLDRMIGLPPLPHAPQMLLVLDTCYGSASGVVLETLVAAPGASPRISMLTSAHELAGDGSFIKALNNILTRRLGSAQRFITSQEIVSGVNSYFRARGSSQRSWLFSQSAGARDTFFLNPAFIPHETATDGVSSTAITPYSSTFAESGVLFTGRSAALRVISGWLSAPSAPGQTVCVVTGGPGSGKSATLGRLVMETNRLEITRDAEAVGPPLVPRHFAVVALDAWGKTAESLLAEVADVLGLPRRGAPGAIETLRARTDSDPILLVIDSLNEAEPAADRFFGTLANLVDALRTLPGVRTVVGTRRPVAPLLSDGALVIDLDEPRYFHSEDVAAYAQALIGAHLPSSFPNVPDLVDKMASEIASMSGANFRVAGHAARLVADSVALELGGGPQWPDALRATRIQALEASLDMIDLERDRAEQLLLPLAYLFGPEAPNVTIWAALASCLSGVPVDTAEIEWLVEQMGRPVALEIGSHVTSGHGGDGALRTAVAEALGAARDTGRDHTRIVDALLTLAPPPLSAASHPYVLAHLASHAALAPPGTVERVIAVPGFLSHADPGAIRRALPHAHPASRRAFAALFEGERMAAFTRDQRRSALAIAATQTGHRLAPMLSRDAPRRVLWATRVLGPQAGARQGLRRLSGKYIQSVAAASVDGQQIIAISGSDEMVRLWDIRSEGSRLLRSVTIAATDHGIRGMAMVNNGEQAWLVAVGGSGAVRVWDLRTAGPYRVMRGSSWPNGSVAGTTIDGIPCVVTGGDDRVARVWDLMSGVQRGVLSGHAAAVSDVACISIGGRPHVVTASHDQSVRVWDLQKMELRRVLSEPRGLVQSVACTMVDQRSFAVTASDDGSVTAWDLSAGRSVAVCRTGSPVTAMICATIGGRPSAVFCGEDGFLRIWDLRGGAVTEIALPDQATAVAWSEGAIVLGVGADLVALDGLRG